jgi:DNA-binding MarR family transcriptional regulator
MSSTDEQIDTIGGMADRELRLLAEVHRRPQASQRELARRVGIALGMTNLLLHNLAEKGYVRITRAGWRRWLYALTPDGFLRKVQLTLSYVHRFLDHYQKVRQTLREELAVQSLNAESRVAILGTGEFAELVYLGLNDLGYRRGGCVCPRHHGWRQVLGAAGT